MKGSFCGYGSFACWYSGCLLRLVGGFNLNILVAPTHFRSLREAKMMGATSMSLYYDSYRTDCRGFGPFVMHSAAPHARLHRFDMLRHWLPLSLFSHFDIHFFRSPNGENNKMAAITIDPTIATWQVAVERLDPNLRARLVIAGADTFDTFNILNSVLDQAEQQKNVCLRKRWKVDIQGKQVILRDVFDKITAWVDKFKGVVDVAVQYDTGSASLPWAGIRFLLQVSSPNTKVTRGLSIEVRYQ